jgi:hypothetical protein
VAEKPLFRRKTIPGKIIPVPAYISGKQMINIRNSDNLF